MSFVYDVIISVLKCWTILKEAMKPSFTHAPSTHACMHAHICADTHIYMYPYSNIHICAYTFMYIGIPTHMHACEHTWSLLTTPLWYPSVPFLYLLCPPLPFQDMDFLYGNAASLTSVDSEIIQHYIRKNKACSRFVVSGVHRVFLKEYINNKNNKAPTMARVLNLSRKQKKHAWVNSRLSRLQAGICQLIPRTWCSTSFFFLWEIVAKPPTSTVGISSVVSFSFGIQKWTAS